MKKIFCFLIILISVVGLMFSPVLATTVSEEYINQADVDLLTMVDDVLTEFAEAAEAGRSDEQLLVVIDKIIGALQSLIEHEFSQEVNQNYFKQTDVIKQKATDLQKELMQLKQAYLSDYDENQVSVVAEQVGVALENYVEVIERLNDVVDASNQTPDNFATFYFVLLLIMAILTFGSFVWSFRWPEAVPERLKARHQIAYFSLIPLAGATITYFSYRFTSADGEYMIAWGAVIFGLINYVRAIVSYRKLLQSTD